MLLDRLDDTIEPLARAAGGKALWDEMKENALLATTAVVRTADGVQEAGGAAQVARLLHEWQRQDPGVEIHLAAHSGGSVLIAPLLQLLTTEGQVVGGPAHGMSGLGGKVESVNLWAPAATMEMFLMSYVPAIESGRVDRAGLFTLTDKAENDDHCAGVYHKSLLYLIAHAFEAQARSWVDRRMGQGTPLAGMARFIEAKTPADQAYGYERVQELIHTGRLAWIQSPTPAPPPDTANATAHGGFDDDRATLEATIARILGKRGTAADFDINRSEAGLDERRRILSRAFDRSPG